MAARKVDSTLLVLREIRDEARKTNERLDRLTERVDAVYRYVPEMEIRLSTAITGMAGALGEVRDMLRNADEDRKRMAALEHRMDTLERKVG